MPTQSTTRLRVSRFLQQQLRTLDAGQPLPSIRQVKQACRAGSATVGAVVRELVDEGVIHVRHRSGLYKSETATPEPPSNQTVEAVISVHDTRQTPVNFMQVLVERLAECCRRDDRALRIHMLPDNPTRLDIETLLRRDGLHAFILAAVIDPAVQQAVVDSHCQVVHLFPSVRDLSANSIISDPYRCTHLQVAYLAERGHRHIAYLHHAPPRLFHRDLTIRRELFPAVMSSFGLSARDEWVRYCGYEGPSVLGVMGEILSAPERPTAVICPDHALSWVYEGASRAGLKVGEDFSVLGTDDLPIASMVHPPASTLRIDLDTACRTAIQWLDDLSRGKNHPEPKFLPTDIIPRRSIHRV